MIVAYLSSISLLKLPEILDRLLRDVGFAVRILRYVLASIFPDIDPCRSAAISCSASLRQLRRPSIVSSDGFGAGTELPRLES